MVVLWWRSLIQRGFSFSTAVYESTEAVWHHFIPVLFEKAIFLLILQIFIAHISLGYKEARPMLFFDFKFTMTEKKIQRKSSRHLYGYNG